MIIPIDKKSKRRKTGTESTQVQSSDLVTVRLREISPLYQDVTIRCALGTYLAEAPTIHSADDVINLFGFLEYESREMFFALHLSSKNEIICLDQVSVGSLSATIVHPREVYKSALLSSAAALIFIHNHPSGDPTPSYEDHQIHQRLVETGELLGIRVLDHIIIGSRGRHQSLATVETTADGEDASCEEAPALFI